MAASNARRLMLPLVCVTQQESSLYARDARYIGFLSSSDPDLILVAKSIKKAILMKQEPEQSFEWPTGLVKRFRKWPWKTHHPIYFSPRPNFKVDSGPFKNLFSFF
jgi:hypothetical protein